MDAIDQEIQKRIDWHRSNTYDPYNISMAIIGALEEVRSAIKDATDFVLDRSPVRNSQTTEP